MHQKFDSSESGSSRALKISFVLVSDGDGVTKGFLWEGSFFYSNWEWKAVWRSRMKSTHSCDTWNAQKFWEPKPRAGICHLRWIPGDEKDQKNSSVTRYDELKIGECLGIEPFPRTEGCINVVEGKYPTRSYSSSVHSASQTFSTNIFFPRMRE